MLPILIAILAMQGRALHETSSWSRVSPEGRCVLHAALESDVQDPEPLVCRFTGKGTYTLEIAEHAVWSKTLGFALEDAYVLDDGRIAGIGYSEMPTRNRGCAHFVVLDRNGAVRVEERLDLSLFGVDQDGCTGAPSGSYVDVANDRFVVWMWLIGRPAEEWRAWSLTTGQRTSWAPKHPATEPVSSCSGALPVGRTGLVLLHRWIAGRGDDTASRATLFHSTYALIDKDGQELWHLPVDADRVETEPHHAAPGANGIVAADEHGFTVRVFATHELVHCALEHDEAPGSAWKVRELSREVVAAPR